MEDLIIVISKKPGRFTSRVNKFCMQSYWDCMILKKGKMFSRLPDVYFSAFWNNIIVGSLGVFYTYPLPLEEVFDFIAEPDSIEFGRLAILRKAEIYGTETRIPRQMKLHVAKKLILTAVSYFGEENSNHPCYIETYYKVYVTIKEAIGVEFMRETNARIVEEKIPWISWDFYKEKNPKIHRIDIPILTLKGGD